MGHMPKVSRRVIMSLSLQKKVLVDGRPKPPSFRVLLGREICIIGLSEIPFRPIPNEYVGVRLVDVKDDWLVVDKEAGLPSVVLNPEENKTVANWLAATFPECVLASISPWEAGLVHRLDNET